MRRMLGLAALIIACGAAAGCGDQTPAAPPAPGASLGTELKAPKDTALKDTTAKDTSSQVVTVLTRVPALPQDIVASAVIGESGGSIEIKDAGVKLTVPKGAVSVPTTFSVRALAGDMVAYEFEPHGAQFPVSLAFEQNLVNTNMQGLKSLLDLSGGYFRSTADLDPSTKTAEIAEQLPAILSVKDKVKLNVSHFSGYLLASGRAATQ
jgi:ZU5 domain